MSNAKDFIIENGVLINYTGGGGDVIIPDTVRAIAGSAFQNNKNLKSVVVGKNVSEIMAYAFAFCDNLKRVDCDGVKIIGSGCFKNCTNLEEVNLSEGLEKIGSEVFIGCKSLKSIVIPRSVREIYSFGKHFEGYHFLDSGIEEITLPITFEAFVQKYLYKAFDSCGSLRKITVNSGTAKDIKDMKSLALSLKQSFSDDHRLEIVYAPECPINVLGDFKPYAVLGYVDLLDNGINIDPTIALSYEKYIKSNKQKLYSFAVKNHKLLRYMTNKKIIPAQDIEKLLELAKQQDDLEIAAVILDYKNRCFSQQDMESAIEKAEQKQLKMPTDTEILKKLWSTKKLPDGTLCISRYKGKEDVVEIPNKIGKGIVTEIGESAFKKNVNLVKVIIPDSITRIGECAFNECKNLKEVILPNSITDIGFGAFIKCKEIQVMNIPDNVVSIGAYAFSDCTKLHTVNLPVTIKSIGDKTFKNCNKLKTLTMSDDINIEGNPFLKCKKLVDKKGFLIKNDTLFYYCGKELNVTIPENVIKIAYEAFERSGIESVVVPKTVESIGDRVFRWCDNLKNITFYNSITSISNEAFNGCRSLESIAIPDTVTSIGYSAFSNCEKIRSITMPSTVTSIEFGTFKNCRSLESFIIPDSVTSIENDAFSFCSSLKSIVIPDSVTSINNGAFSVCDSLNSVTIPDSVKSIGYGVFSFSNKLTLKVKSGSRVETYAKENNIPFVAE